MCTNFVDDSMHTGSSFLWLSSEENQINNLLQTMKLGYHAFCRGRDRNVRETLYHEVVIATSKCSIRPVSIHPSKTFVDYPINTRYILCCVFISTSDRRTFTQEGRLIRERDEQDR